MTVGIVGLGLIGGSFAKAYKACEEEKWQVLAYDKDKSILGLAKIAGDIDGELNTENIGECDLIILSLYPQATVEFVRENATLISKDAVVIDACGTKRMVYEKLSVIANENGFLYIGGHPMAGRHFSGYKYAMKTLFKDSAMIIIPPVYDDMKLIDRVKKLLAPAKFGKFTITNPMEHDKIIAFTSQMAHVVSNAFIKSPTAKQHKGFSAGSYKDLTRVAWLNEGMWTELFMENKENLIYELDILINSLKEYKEAMENDDAETLKQLLYDGKMCKEADK